MRPRPGLSGWLNTDRKINGAGYPVNAASVGTRANAMTRPELFVAYAESDAEWVHGFLLPELGLDPQSVLTPRDFSPGAMLVTELERAVESAQWTLVVLSPAFGLSHWSAFAELLATHDSLMRDSARLIPLLLEPYDLPLRLHARVRLDCTVPSRWAGEVARLRDLLHRDAPLAERLPCPYPGLMAFGPDDAALFFGRDQEADDISRRIRQQNFLLVLGPSGSGKSSLVLAGVLPRLAEDGRWLIRTLRPDAGALAWLTGTFGGEAASPGEDQLREAVDTLLRADALAERLLLFFDQAETIFLLRSKQERALFLALLDRLRRVDRCVVLLAMRADFYADLMTSVLWPLDRGERIEIAPLRSAALREAITRPAAGAGVYLEPVLAERLLRDAGEEPGALSLAQETMVLLWERRTRRLLTVSAYEDLGGQDPAGRGRSGLAAALAIRADATLAGLSPAQRAIARRIFVRLVQLGEGRQDTRRPQPIGALRAAGDDPALFDATLRHLTGRRLVTVSADGEESAVDLGHEAMITHWPALWDWIDGSRASELTRRRIERDSGDWLRNGRDAGELYRRRKLAGALEVAAGDQAELSKNAVRFLAAGRRRRRLGLLGVWIVAAGALGGIVWLAKTPVRDAWLQHEAEAFSPQVRVLGGLAIVGNGAADHVPVAARGRARGVQPAVPVLRAGSAVCPAVRAIRRRAFRRREPYPSRRMDHSVRRGAVLLLDRQTAAHRTRVGAHRPGDRRRHVPLGQHPAQAWPGQRRRGRPSARRPRACRLGRVQQRRQRARRRAADRECPGMDGHRGPPPQRKNGRVAGKLERARSRTRRRHHRRGLPGRGDERARFAHHWRPQLPG